MATIRVSAFLSALSPAFGRLGHALGGRRRDGRAERHRSLFVVVVRLGGLAAGQTLQIGLTPAAAARLDQPLRRVAVRAAFHRRHRASQRVGRQQVEILRDGMARIACGHRHRLVGPDQSAHAADVENDVVVRLDAPILEQCFETGELRLVRLQHRIEHQEQLAALGQVRLDHVDLWGQEIGARTGHHEHVGIRRDRRLLREHHLVDLEVVGGERRVDAVVAGAVGARRVLFAMALDEVNLGLSALHDLDQRVGELLLPVRRRLLVSPRVVEDHRAAAT